ncbi:MAG: type II secretion system F family protein [Actinobacteria bacterium]|nr:type II secretion system F family protein [Actinomycetota bacterium]
MPDVVDLLSVAVAAGLNVRLAVSAVVEAAPPGPLVDALGHVLKEVDAGSRLADALARIPDHLGEPTRPVVAALVDGERYGTPVAGALAQVAAEARRWRQRQAEEAARRVPVKLLFPLVTCILPAFGLLAVAPLIAGGLRALRLP